MLNRLTRSLPFVNGPHGHEDEVAVAPVSAEALPVPLSIAEALSRISDQYVESGIPVGADEHDLPRDIAGPETIALMSERLGLNVRFETISRKTQRKLPPVSIALTKTGGAYILTESLKGVFIEGKSGKLDTQLAALEPFLSGRLIIPNLENNAVRRLLGQANSAANSFADEHRTTILGQSLRTLWNDHRPLLIQLATAAILTNMFLIALPLFIMSVYDRIIPHSAIESLQTLALGITIILLADLGVRYARLKFVDALGLSLSSRIQRKIYQQILFAPMAKSPKSSSALTSLQGEIDNFTLLLPEVLAGIVADALFSITVLMIVFMIGGPVVFGPIAGMMIVVALIASTANATMRQNKISMSLRSATTQQMNETIDSLSSIKSTGAEYNLLARYERLTGLSAGQLHLTRHKARFASNAASIIIQLTIVGTVVLSVFRISGGMMSIGSMAAITILVGRAVMPIAQLTDNICKLLGTAAVINRTLADLPEEEPSARDLTSNRRSFSGKIATRSVSYTHPDTERPALEGMNLEINAGERIALVGRNGSGKSTLLRLLSCIYAPSTGTMLYDDHEASQYGARFLRRQIGYLDQDVVLVQGSLRDNICLGLTEIDEQQLARAVQLSGVDRFARLHPQGYGMNVGPRGSALSAGEKQSVGLARLFMRDCRVLVLDEPTSMMDQSAEAHIIEALKALPSDITIIVSTHRLRLLNAVDRVITLDAGRIVKDSTVKELMAMQAPAKSAANS
ncbi:ATP-binding cassette domain-containing protein [Parvularcula marina]|uniref:ATP-binding cassette domain-containing protein n=1 Tax=Parvularcula marina TaxID=2292771 RepID=A0A371RI35_9PROT|nr:ATP-binding cassette domain-containing protein [Parvularcula marina]RFB05095.1 ATP-binding cassette domain-containing protein [Parvularcula marina]